MDPGAPPDAGRVDQFVLATVALKGHADTVPGRAGLIVDHQPVLAEQAVDERRLAHVRTPHDRDLQRLRRIGGICRRLVVGVESGQRRLHHRGHAVAVGGGNGGGRAESQRVKLRVHEFGIESFALVRRQNGALCVASRKIGDVLVGRGEATAPVHEYDRDVGLGERSHRLFRHALVDFRFTAREPAGVDDDVGTGPDPTESVLAIPGQSRVIRDQRIAGSGQPIEQRRLADVRPADDSDYRQHGIGGPLVGLVLFRFGLLGLGHGEGRNLAGLALQVQDAADDDRPTRDHAFADPPSRNRFARPGIE